MASLEEEKQRMVHKDYHEHEETKVEDCKFPSCYCYHFDGDEIALCSSCARTRNHDSCLCLNVDGD